MRVDDADLYRWFVEQVQRNLHIIFTMNPQSPDFYNRTATSPALFNRCTIDWFGEWSDEALNQVAVEYTLRPALEQYKCLPYLCMSRPVSDPNRDSGPFLP